MKVCNTTNKNDHFKSLITENATLLPYWYESALRGRTSLTFSIPSYRCPLKDWVYSRLPDPTVPGVQLCREAETGPPLSETAPPRTAHLPSKEHWPGPSEKIQVIFWRLRLFRNVTLLRETEADRVHLDLKPETCGGTMDAIREIRLRGQRFWATESASFFYPRISILPNFFQESLPVLRQSSSYPQSSSVYPP